MRMMMMMMMIMLKNKNNALVWSMVSCWALLSSSSVGAAFSVRPPAWWGGGNLHHHLSHPPKNEGTTTAGTAATAAAAAATSPLLIPVPPANAAVTTTPWDSLEQKLLYGSGDAPNAVASASSSLSTPLTRSSPPPVDTSSTSTTTADFLSSLLKSASVSESSLSSSSSAAAAVVVSPVPPLEPATTTTPPSFLDQTAAHAQSVLDSVRELSSYRATTTTTTLPLSPTTATTPPLDDDTVLSSLGHFEDTIRHLFQQQHGAAAPSSSSSGGEGLSKPIVDYVMTTLYELRDSPYNPPHWFHNEGLPTTFVTTSSGVQVKQYLLQSLADLQSMVRVDAKNQWSNVEQMIAQRMVTNYETVITQPLRTSYEHSAVPIIGTNLVQAVQTNWATTETTIGNTLQSNYETYYQPLRTKLVESLMTTTTSLPTTTMTAAKISTAAILDAWQVSMDQLALVQTDLQRLIRTPGWRPEDVLTTLKMQELGPFYVGVALAMLLAVSYSTQRLANVTDRTTDPASVVPDNSSRSASLPKEPLLRRTNTALRVQTASVGMDERTQLENVVADLTQATAILATEMKSMAAELRQLKQQQQQEQQPPGITTAAAAAAVPTMAFQSTTPPMTQPAATMTMMTAPPTISTPVVSAFAVMDKNEDKLAKVLLDLDLQNELLRVQLNAAQFESNTLSEVNEALAAGAEALASYSAQEPVVSQTFPSLEELGLSDAYFIAGAAAVNGNYESLPQTQSVLTAPTTPSGPMKTAVLEVPDWSNLSLAALKRKTEDELQEYLASKGMLPGKSRDLKKADLLALVMDMA